MGKKCGMVDGSRWAGLSMVELVWEETREPRANPYRHSAQDQTMDPGAVEQKT